VELPPVRLIAGGEALNETVGADWARAFVVPSAQKSITTPNRIRRPVQRVPVEEKLKEEAGRFVSMEVS